MKKYLVVLAVLLCSGVNAQRFDALLKTLNTEYRQERLYLHFDRSIYNAGETIWFKAYLFAGNYPSLISKTLYTELLDAKGKVLQRVTSLIIMSSSASSIEIPADVKSAVFVRSYTKWMLNFDSSFLYTKAISILPPKSGAKPTASSSTTSTNSAGANSSSSLVLQFFPEGGDLVEGVESRVAFKATTRSGMPVDVEGRILDSKGNEAAIFSSMHDGMGYLILQPKKGEHYRASWKDQNGQSHETALPAAKQNGIVLEVNSNLNQVEFDIRRSADDPSPYPFVYVVMQMQQQLLYRAKATIGKAASTTGLIPAKNLPAGIIQVTVFSPDEQPLAERIVFANSADHSFIISLNAPTKDVGKRKKNIIEIDLPDTLSCNLSMAITDADLNPAHDADNIYSHVLLTSDIKGYVHNPAYYFSNDADSVANHLDLVMMTNGWRRFSWQQALAGKFPPLNYLPENYISVEGKVKGMGAKLLEEQEINGIIEFKDNKRVYVNTPVLADGKFSFSGMIFYDTAKLFYQFNKDKNKTLTSRAGFSFKNNVLKDALHLQPDFALTTRLKQPETAVITKNQNVYEEQQNALESQKAHVLKTVVVKTAQKTKQDLMDEEYASGFFRDAGRGRTILPETDPAFLSSASLLSYLQGRIAGLQVDMSVTEDAISWRGITTSLFVNEISQSSISQETGKRVEDANYIMSLPMSDIAMVKILEPPFFGAWGAGAGGAISVYLKKPGDRKTKPLDHFILPGYSPLKEFYSPDYSLPALTDAPDYRSTLYWNPLIIADKNHRHISLSFYNNDITKKMRVIIEGCNENGKLTRIEKVLQ